MSRTNMMKCACALPHENVPACGNNPLVHPHTEATPQIQSPPVPNARLAWAARVAHLLAVADRVGNCGKGAYLWDGRFGHHAMVIDRRTGRPICALSSCRHRLCPRCAVVRTVKIGARLVRLVSAHFERHPVFVTLTAGAEGALPVADMADRVLRAVGRLRRSVAWHKAVRGGFFALDFDGPGGRHVHIHACVDAHWIEHEPLLRAWRRALRKEGANGAQNGGVHVERARDAGSVVRYCVKTISADLFGDEDLPALLWWMNRRHLVQTFGCLHGRVVAEPAPTVPSPAALRRGVPRVSGLNAATGEPVPAGALVWQFSEQANALGALAAAGAVGALRAWPDALPDEVPGVVGDPARRGEA